MLDFMKYITDINVITFLLLLLRFSGILAFFPFFDNQIIPPSVRAALGFILTVVFMPFVNSIVAHPSFNALILAGLLELMLGFICGLVLQIVFSSIIFASDVISFSMGLTMASAYDPVSGAVKPIVGQVIILLSVIMALHFNFHYILIEILVKTLNTTPLGGFLFSDNLIDYFIRAFSNMFMVGFSMAFPIIAMILLSDIIFGMIMKTHPQFNLLVIGFPVKIGIALVILTVIIPGIIIHFRSDLSEAFKIIWKILS